MLRLDSLLRLVRPDYESALVSFEAYDSAAIRSYKGSWVRLGYDDIFSSQAVAGDIDQAERNEKDGAGVVEIVMDRLGDFRPDVVFMLSEFPALNRQLPDAAFLNIEFSWFSRHLFPEYYQLDLFGRGKARFAAENIKLFAETALSPSEQMLLAAFRKKASKAVDNKEANEFIASLRKDFPSKRLIILPLAERYVLDGRTPVAVGLDRLFSQGAVDDLYVVTVHPGDNCLNGFELSWLERKHSNVRFCKNKNIHTAALLPKADAVVGDFSSAGLYGLIFNVAVVSVLDQLPAVDNFFASRNPLTPHLVGLEQERRNRLLLSLLLHSTLPPGKLFDGPWMSRYLDRAITCKRSGNLSGVFDEPLVSVEDWLKDPWLEGGNQLGTWLAARTLKPVQQQLTRDYLSAHKVTTLAVYVLASGKNDEALWSTLASLSGDGFPVVIKCVVLSEREPDITDWPDIRFAKAPVAEYAARLNELVREVDADWMMVVSAGDTFEISGLHMLGVELTALENCEAVYADELIRGGDAIGALFRPDFNLDLLLSLPSGMARHWLYRQESFVELGGFDARYPAALELDLITRLIEQKGISAIGHLDEPLLIADSISLLNIPDEVSILERHLQRRGYPNGKVVADLPGRYRLIYNHDDNPLVSIIVPTKDQLPMLLRCITSLLEKTRYPNFEVLIVDNNSETAEARDWLNGVEKMGADKVRVLRYPHPFNYSAINNMAAREARGEYLVLLNNDTAILREDWLEALMNHGQRPEVGIVGAKLLYPTGQIQHAGVILGLRGPADHPFIGAEQTDSGYMQRMQVDQNLTAVTAACLLIRKSIYEDVGGLDEEAFKVSYNDVDLCLKVREAGYLTVWTPHSVVMHVGNVSQNNVDPAKAEAKRKRFMAEQDAMYEKWLPLIARDPAYNANLSLNGKGFEIEVDANLTWRPLSWRPLPVVLAHMADKTGCGQYRVIQPFNAAKEAGLIDGTLSGRLLSIPELERYNPDSIVLQRQVTDAQLEIVGRMNKFSKAFKVFELDDYLPNLPIKSVHRGHIPKDILKSIRRGLGYVDRFVVSTEPLAEAFAGMHADIQVVKNRLDPRWWTGLSSERRVSDKPRVGWAGGSSHTGDLEMIADVVKELANEVEWVFFGMCPDKLRPYVHEFHPGIDIEEYPAALAGLNLDLALAPVEPNLFNECKSNLRLLEYGACGFPVVCTDLVCYQGDLPVTRVKNRFKDWVDAIRMHLSDLDATAKIGDELRAAVHKDWMLEGDNLELWRKAWLPG